MNGFGPYVAPFAWFRAYWLLFAALLGAVAVFFWVRGKNTGLKNRLRLAGRSYRANRLLVPGLVAILLALGGFIFYNTNVEHVPNHQTRRAGAGGLREKI